MVSVCKHSQVCSLHQPTVILWSCDTRLLIITYSEVDRLVSLPSLVKLNATSAETLLSYLHVVVNNNLLTSDSSLQQEGAVWPSVKPVDALLQKQTKPKNNYNSFHSPDDVSPFAH